MSESPDVPFQLKCLQCGFAAAHTSDVWDHAEHPALGRIPECPECASTQTSYISNVSPEEE